MLHVTVQQSYIVLKRLLHAVLTLLTVPKLLHIACLSAMNNIGCSQQLVRQKAPL